MTAKRPAVVAFDVVETLFSLAPVAQALEPLDVALDLLFARILRDGFALAAAGDQQPFQDIARAALGALAPSASGQQSERVLASFGQLPPHRDAEPALAELAAAGVPVVTLTNGGYETTS